MSQFQSNIVLMTQDEEAFFQALGKRLARCRKAQELTQAQLGEFLGVSQQTINSFEKGRRRVPVSALPELSRVLGISVEALVGSESPPAKRGPTPRLQQQLEQINQLPRSKQRFVMEMLDTVLQQAR